MNSTDAITPSNVLGNLEGSTFTESPNMSSIGMFAKIEPTRCFAATIFSRTCKNELARNMYDA